MPDEVMVAQPVRSSMNASTLLEEMLHTDLYGRFWNQHGYWHPAPQVPTHLGDLSVVASRLMDEYITNRRKAELIGTRPMIEFNGRREAAITMTPLGELVEELHQSRRQLGDIVKKDVAGQPAVDTYKQIVTWMKRTVFLPLAYDAGKRSWNLPVEGTIGEASQVPFVDRNVRQSWNKILVQMERARTTNLQEFPQAAAEIVEELRRFMTHVGIHLRNDGVFEIRRSFHRWQ
jgi:hypothetical protein